MATVLEREENAYTLAVQAGLWGFPLAHRVEAFPPAMAVKGLGLNYLAKFPRLKTADDRFVVTPNNLTIDGYAALDVSREPVVVYVPALDAPRWFVVQIGDAFDDVAYNVGGIKPAVPGPYLITGPEFQGRVPGEMAHIKLRTKIGFVAARIAVFGSADLPDAVRAQEGFRIVPFRQYLEHGIGGPESEANFGPIPFPELTAPKELEFFDRIGSAMSYMLPAELDVNDTFVQALGLIGLSVARGFDWRSLDESTHSGLVRAIPMIEKIIDERWHSIGTTIDGWRSSLATGRCSYDFALNSANTKNQVGTELAEAVVYANCKVDADGKPFNGANNYELHFKAGQTPPVAGMWNLAMYDDEMFFVPNDANRFTIGSTTDGLTKATDGSTTIYIQRTRPDGEKANNWLPAPAGSFNLTMRYYAPLSPVLDRTYNLPQVHMR